MTDPESAEAVVLTFPDLPYHVDSTVPVESVKTQVLYIRKAVTCTTFMHEIVSLYNVFPFISYSLKSLFASVAF